MRRGLWLVLAALACLLMPACDAVTNVRGVVYEDSASTTGASRIELLPNEPVTAAPFEPLEDARVTITRGSVVRHLDSKANGEFEFGLATSPFAATTIEVQKEGFSSTRFVSSRRGSVEFALRVVLHRSNTSEPKLH